MNSSSTMLAQKQWHRPDRRFYGVTTEDLLLDVSWIHQCRLDVIDDPHLSTSTRKHTLEYLDHRAAPIIRELKRRHEQHERHKQDPHRHPWPKSEQYEKTLRLARELKRSIPLSTYIRYTLPGVRLRKTGSNWTGLCPYHPDDNPSFVVYDDNRFTCFGCGMKGDIYALVALVDNLDRFSDQVRSLAAWTGQVAS